MKKLGLILIEIILIISLTACGYGELKGKIVDKNYSPAKTTTQFYYIKGHMYPRIYRKPQRWEIKIQKTESGETKTTWVGVTEEYYNNSKIGDYYLGG